MLARFVFFVVHLFFCADVVACAKVDRIHKATHKTNKERERADVCACVCMQECMRYVLKSAPKGSEVCWSLLLLLWQLESRWRWGS